MRTIFLPEIFALPTMIHAHYKGLATKVEAEKWFTVNPPQAAKNVIQLRKMRKA